MVSAADSAHELVQVTPIGIWRAPRKEGVIFHFPSGNTARIRPVNVDTFIAAIGGLPDGLTGIVSAMIGGRNPLEAASALDEAAFAQITNLYNVFCTTCFIEPKVVLGETEKPYELSANDISDADKQMLFAFLGQPAAALAAFRPSQTYDVATVADGEGDASATE